MATGNVSPESIENAVDVKEPKTTEKVESVAVSCSNHSLETLQLKEEEEKDEARVVDVVLSKTKDTVVDNKIMEKNVKSLESSPELEGDSQRSSQLERIDPSCPTETISDITITDPKEDSNKIGRRHGETAENEPQTDLIASLAQNTRGETLVNGKIQSVSAAAYELDVSETSYINKIPTEDYATYETLEVPIGVKDSEFLAPTDNKVQDNELRESVADESLNDQPSASDDESLVVIEKTENDQLEPKVGNSGEGTIVHDVELTASKAVLPPSETILPLSETELTLTEFDIPQKQSEDLVSEKEPLISETEVFPLDVEPALPEARVPSLETEPTISEAEVPPSQTEIPLPETPESENVVSPEEPKPISPEVAVRSIEIQTPSVVEVAPLETELPFSETEFAQRKVDPTLQEVVTLSETAETSTPIPKQEGPLSQTKSHLPKYEILPSQTVPTLPKVDVPSDTESLSRQAESALSEGEPLASETEIPRVETTARKEEEPIESLTSESTEVVKEMVNDDLSSPVGPTTDIDKPQEPIDNNFEDNLGNSVLPTKQTSKVEEETELEEKIEKAVDQTKAGEGNHEGEKTDGTVECRDLNSTDDTKVDAMGEPTKREVTIKSVHRQSNNIMSKLKKSIVIVKKVITGKSPSTKSPSSKAEVNVTQ